MNKENYHRQMQKIVTQIIIGILLLIGIMQLLVLAHLIPDFAIFQSLKNFAFEMNFWIKVIILMMIQGYLFYSEYWVLRFYYEKGWSFRFGSTFISVVIIALISRFYFDILWDKEDWYIGMLGSSYSFLIVSIMAVIAVYLTFPRFPKGTI
jgi:hypothetical protein